MPLHATLPELLLARASDTQSSAKISLLDSKGEIYKIFSYADLFDEASTLAQRLIAIGVTQKDILLASFSDHGSHIRLFWACCLAGIPICTLPASHHDPAQQAKMFKHLRELFHNPILVTTTDGVQDIHVQASEIRAISLHELPTECPGAASKIFPAQPPSPDDVVCLMLKSGSTGTPKAIPLSHSNLLSSIRGRVRHHNSTSQSRFLNWMPFDHVASVSEIHLHALEANASQWHVDPMSVIFDPCSLLIWASTFKITYTLSSPFLLTRIAREARITSLPQQVDLSHLQALVCWGDAVPQSTAIAIADLIEGLSGSRNVLRTGFGKSETAGSICDICAIEKVDPDSPETPRYMFARKFCDGVRTRVIDATTGTECPVLKTGHLQISGPSVFTGYYGGEGSTRESFTRDGWFVTGHLAQLDGDGDLILMQEEEDCINIDDIKYPVHDVEHYIEDARIDGLIQSTIYVCPMRLAGVTTETYAVFYGHKVALDLELDTKKRILRKINEEIRSVCTAFVSRAPHVVLPLSRYALVELALGKVSRSTLSAMYLEGGFKDIQDALVSKANFEEVPIIDFALSQSDPDAYFEQLHFALEDVGFGIFVNVPGFEASFQEGLFSLAEKLFNMPQEWKNSLGTDKSPSLRGYFRADNVSGSHKSHAEAYRFGLDLPPPGKLEDPSIPFWLKLHEGPNQWPPEDQLPLFREKMEILFHRYHALNLQLNSHICQLLSIPDETLQDYFPKKTEFNCAIWHYFPVTSEFLKEAANGFVQGMHEHRDPSTFVTCLIQSRQGLQVQNHQGAWIDIPMVEGGVVCNIGMQLMNLTGGKLVATTHRVNTLKIEKDRFTIPYVLSTKLDKPIIPLPAFASPESAKPHVAPNPKIAKLMAIKDPLMRSGYARLTLFPAATQLLYPAEFEEARRMGIV